MPKDITTKEAETRPKHHCLLSTFMVEGRPFATRGRQTMTHSGAKSKS